MGFEAELSSSVFFSAGVDSEVPPSLPLVLVLARILAISGFRLGLVPSVGGLCHRFGHRGAS